MSGMSIFQSHKTMWIVAVVALVAILATAAVVLLSTGPGARDIFRRH